MKTPSRITAVPMELLLALADEVQAPIPFGANRYAERNGHSDRRLDVPKWLAARGIEYRIKPAAASGGRTVYLIPCPFDSSHTGGDCCIMQEPSGKLSAHCFHNSCAGRGWQEFKQKIGPPEPDHFDPPLKGITHLAAAQTDSTRGAAETGCKDGGGEDRPQIVISTEEHEVNEQAVRALARDRAVYQRGDLLVRMVEGGGRPPKGIRRPSTPRIDPLPRALLQERLAAVANWLIPTEKGLKPAHPPGFCVSAVHARADYPGIPPLEAVVDHPVLRPDGTVLNTPGYDEDTGVFLAPAGQLPELKESPRREDALAARAALENVVTDFPFEAPAHKAAWFAALLTPLARFAFEGPAPLFLVDANAAGVGKGLLLNVTSTILTGANFTLAAYTQDEDELRKRITSIAVGGDRTAVFDNLAGKFGNATLDLALTSTTWSDRVLGISKMFHGPLLVTWYATGNNVAVHGDTVRRTCHIRLETRLERPEERSGFEHPHLLRWVAKRRSKLLGAALTILRAFCMAGKPDMNLTAWGSYEGWSALVRSAVKWVGLEDPGSTRTALRDHADTEVQAVAVLLRCWQKMDPEQRGLRVSRVLHELFEDRGRLDVPPWHADMKDAIESLIGSKPDPRALGNKLRYYRLRVVDGRCLDTAGSKKALRWVVLPAKEG